MKNILKKLILLSILPLIMSACAVTSFKSGDISETTISYMAEKRQNILETSEDKELHTWSKGSINGEMYIFSTWQKEDGQYCRRLFERIISGLKEQELYNEWCRVGKGQWAVNVK